MEVQNKLNINNDLSIKERNMILEVMKNYNVNVINIKRIRSAYKIETDNETLCLKKMKHGKLKSKNGCTLVEELYKNNFINTPKYIKTQNGLYFVKLKGLVFYVTEWINGEECKIDTIEDAKKCIKLLAKFHIATLNIDSSKLIIRNNLKNWPVIFSNNLNDMERFKKIIEKKKIKSEFDLAYSKYIDVFIRRGEVALGILNESSYYSLSKEASDKKTICHDSFYYQNIMLKDGEYYLVDLDSIIIDLHINDLGKFIRRLMYKSQYSWKFDVAKEIIESYNELNKISKAELEAMLSLIIFPHKFWKLGKKRYLKYKNWNEKKYMHKLNKLIKYTDEIEKFIESYMKYIDEHV